MFKKIAIISFGFFILSGNFNNFAFFNSLPIDISILSMVIPGIYFILYSLKTMSVHKSFFVIIAFLVSLIPTIFYLNSESEKLIMFLMIFFVLSLISPTLLDNKLSLRLFIKTLLITSLTIVLLALFGLENTHTTGRLTLNGGNPIWLARAVSIAAFCLLVLLIHNKIRILKFLILFAPTMFIMVSTGSKGPIIAMILAILVIYFSKFKRFITSKRTLTSIGVFLFFAVPIGLVTFMLFPDPFSRLIDTTSIDGNAARVILYSDALNAIKDNPMGIGLGNFIQYSYFDYPHNLILEAFAELGLISGTMLILMLLLSFIGLKRIAKNNVYGDIILGFFIMSFINSMVSGDLTSPKELYLLLPIGLNVFLSMIKRA